MKSIRKENVCIDCIYFPMDGSSSAEGGEFSFNIGSSRGPIQKWQTSRLFHILDFQNFNKRKSMNGEKIGKTYSTLTYLLYDDVYQTAKRNVSQQCCHRRPSELIMSTWGKPWQAGVTHNIKATLIPIGRRCGGKYQMSSPCGNIHFVIAPRDRLFT